MAETYAYMHIKKLKDPRTLQSTGCHNMRLGVIMNADPEKANLNESLIPIGLDKNGKAMNYYEAFKERIKAIEYYKTHTIRKNQVLGLEILMTFSRDKNVDVEKWKIQSMKWLHDKFDIANDNKTNVMNAEFHADETGNVHIHAFIVPIDERGHLCAARFMTRDLLRDLQTTYAEYVADLGIKRGVEGSSARHRAIREMYGRFNQAVEIPPVVIGESAEEYRTRVNDDLETRFAIKYREAEDQANSRRRSVDQYVHNQQEIARSCKKEAEQARSDADKACKKAEEAREELANYESQKEALLNQMHQFQIDRQRVEENEKKAKRYDAIRKGIELLTNEDPARAHETEESINEIEEVGNKWINEHATYQSVDR